ncbi:MAG: hypothetical protein F6K23_11435 [Okeania sp. SIO2C9]|uniref:DNA methyltransferase n=1 Tax=Okeania sp. SIO2C9 TaxID=2607791 RepID=UPI0013C0FF4E|nr:DNA methyltransferase [Okeania sp. SIO2C9]NEQ73618.1 hypothetical protein [Okeania sp. SIO2C9]
MLETYPCILLPKANENLEICRKKIFGERRSLFEIIVYKDSSIDLIFATPPSQKPEALLGIIIRASSCPGDLIIDLFAGTFTTSVVAQKLGRKSISIEREEEYVKLGL